MQRSIPLQRELFQELQRILQHEELYWYAYPHLARRAKRTTMRSSWLTLRLVLLVVLFMMVWLNSLLLHETVFSTTFGLLAGVALVFVFALVVWRRYMMRHLLERTIYAITSQRLIVLTLDSRNQCAQNSYYPADLSGRIDVIERKDGWGDILITGQQRLQITPGSSLVTSIPSLTGVRTKEVLTLLTQLKQRGTGAGREPTRVTQ